MGTPNVGELNISLTCCCPPPGTTPPDIAPYVVSVNDLQGILTLAGAGGITVSSVGGTITFTGTTVDTSGFISITPASGLITGPLTAGLFQFPNLVKVNTGDSHQVLFQRNANQYYVGANAVGQLVIETSLNNAVQLLNGGGTSAVIFGNAGPSISGEELVDTLTMICTDVDLDGTINKLTIAKNPGAGLSITTGKTLTVQNSLTFSGTDGSAIAFPLGVLGYANGGTFRSKATQVGVAPSGNQNIVSATDTKVDWGLEYIDTGSDFNSGTGTFTAPSTGFITVAGQIQWASVPGSPGDEFVYYLYRNGSPFLQFTSTLIGQGSGSRMAQSFSFFVPVTAADTIQLWVASAAGADIDATGTSMSINYES